ncbi:hypothetical protein SUGI_0982880 [Cryptomeria japonica]|uniref:DDT domain-containing protein DDR4 n=1 Tax=Cryptomeria japonica TaxID=3369 RepID=UPI002414965C|nr:DDT domain-containing protein DDR4 [Cryptomeria japonica]GLJ46643.1 hypothetical protein SUGI_0982880 [Cryptomeria japonica]
MCSPIQKNKMEESFVSNSTEEELGKLRSMWQLASVLNFFHVFRPVLEIGVKFSAEDLEAALITPNAMLSDIHISLLKEVLQPCKVKLQHDTWVTMLCKTLKEWWQWVAEGELPIVTSHGGEITAYKELDPGIRLLILKALCEIRLEQDDIRTYISDTSKNSDKFVAFYKEPLEGNTDGTSYWYEDDSSMGPRLYKEIQKVQSQTQSKGRGNSSQPDITCHWETIATNLDEFQRIFVSTVSSGNEVEKRLANKLKNDILPEIEKIQKRKEQALQRREQALRRMQRDDMIMDGSSTGRCLRERKPVNYTFDDYDRSIAEAIEITKQGQLSPNTVLENDASADNSPAGVGKEIDL